MLATMHGMSWSITELMLNLVDGAVKYYTISICHLTV